MPISRPDSQRILIPDLNLGVYEFDSYAWISVPKQEFCASANSQFYWIERVEEWILNGLYPNGMVQSLASIAMGGVANFYLSHVRAGTFVGEEPISCVSISLRARSHKLFYAAISLLPREDTDGFILLLNSGFTNF